MVVATLIIALCITLGALIFTILKLLRSSESNRITNQDISGISENLYRRILEQQRIEAEQQRRSFEESSAKILAETRRQYELQIERLEDRLRRQAEDLRTTAAMQFESLSAAALERQSDRLAEESRHELMTLLNPLRENLGEFRKAVNASYMEENASREALNRQIDSLISANRQIGIETRRLSEALHGNTRLQGLWGEQILESLMEKAGFIPDIHFVTQATKDEGSAIKNDEGKAQRPDMIFFLPDNRKIVIDAKTSMTSYLDYCEADCREDEIDALRKHADSVKRHIDELAHAQYHKNIKGALEHTLMFMPNDGAYLAAIRADKEIADYAMKHNVVIVSPAHIFSIISLVSQLWRIDKQNKNAEEIARLGGGLYDKMATFLTDFETIGKHIDNTHRAFEKSRSHLHGSPTSIASRARKLQELGARTSRKPISESV
ncbi:MAG: DNA recombination protein RmuC [Muribaculaceae bacterium]|nr:DNA recombination protein RmuC [Muribaculaceae bacterium]MDE6558346.1 DNA recombination protein RmuC [Muribaculaceae bacterium]